MKETLLTLGMTMNFEPDVFNKIFPEEIDVNDMPTDYDSLRDWALSLVRASTVLKQPCKYSGKIWT